MKKDKPGFSLKINGTNVNETKNTEPPREESTPEIRDWKARRHMEEAAAAVGTKQRKRPRLPLGTNRKKRNPRRPAANKIFQPPMYFISLTAGAAVLGLIFGVMLLQFVSAGDSSTGAEPKADPPGITADFNDSLTAYFIQAGAFTKKSKGIEMQQSLTSEGYPGILTYDGEYYYLFTGVHLQQKKSDERVSFFEDKGIQVFQKTRTIRDPEPLEGKKEYQKQLIRVKELLEQAVDRENGSTGEGTVREAFSDFLSEASLPEGGTNTKLKESIQGMETEWPEKGETSAAFQEAFIETVLYYEQAVYEFNGTEAEEEKS
ncbi:hypothetical protein [Salibacterium qingdaonense]|uniref:SPOR domain-containing protein n=1 Tax=Salibacterium qingdaonense TaxID=266892 RepID=A0A1I4MTA3_9BACI|nr:hypothetical protein [Salibacterium qingdaonense]SFM06295.1 hypothetical protein SAMN04488054_11339 [Salibacterium qingdaonense]